MKVLIVNQILYTHSDGVIPRVNSIKDTMIYQMCMGFKALGHEVTLAAASEYKPIAEEDYDFKVLWFKSNLTTFFPPTLLPYSSAFNRFIKKNHVSFDLIISKEVFSFSSLILSTICPKTTVLWVEQAMHQRKFRKIPSKIWFNVIARLFMNSVRAVVPCSLGAYRFLNRYIPKTSDVIVEHGIDIEKFKPAENKSRYFIVSSQLIKRKNIDSIIHVFASLNKESGFDDLELLIAGRGPEEQYLRQVAIMDNVGRRVTFLGFLRQEELSRYISRAIAFLVNTKSDLNMVSVPESICCATPVVMNEVPLSSWYVDKYKLGIVKNCWGENDLKEIIDKNQFYVSNCMGYRENLSTVHSAGALLSVAGY